MMNDYSKVPYEQRITDLRESLQNTVDTQWHPIEQDLPPAGLLVKVLTHEDDGPTYTWLTSKGEWHEDKRVFAWAKIETEGTVVMDDFGRLWYSPEYWVDPRYVIDTRTTEWLCVSDVPNSRELIALLDQALPAGLPQSCGEHALFPSLRFPTKTR